MGCKLGVRPPRVSAARAARIESMPVAVRPHFEWALRTRALALGGRTLVAGVVNVTPDSFSDGGQFALPEQAVAHALRLLEEGADIVDLGGESTRPGAHAAVSAQQEQDRVLPVLEALLQERPAAIVSIDTYKAATARAAVAAGAEIVNDVSGFLWDEAMAGVCAEMHCGVILTHTRGHMRQWRALPPLAAQEVVPLVLRELRERAETARRAGLAHASIVLDPGFGFGKSFDENYPLLARLEALHALGYPILAGTSRKSFLGRTLAQIHGEDAPPDRRGNATLASIAACVLAGAHLVRVHDVLAAREAVAIADAIRGS